MLACHRPSCNVTVQLTISQSQLAMSRHHHNWPDHLSILSLHRPSLSHHRHSTLIFHPSWLRHRPSLPRHLHSWPRHGQRGYFTVPVDHVTVPLIISSSQLTTSASHWLCHRPREHVTVVEVMSPSILTTSPFQMATSPSHLARSPSQWPCHSSSGHVIVLVAMSPSQWSNHYNSLPGHYPIFLPRRSNLSRYCLSWPSHHPSWLRHRLSLPRHRPSWSNHYNSLPGHHPIFTPHHPSVSRYCLSWQSHHPSWLRLRLSLPRHLHLWPVHHPRGLVTVHVCHVIITSLSHLARSPSQWSHLSSNLHVIDRIGQVNDVMWLCRDFDGSSVCSVRISVPMIYVLSAYLLCALFLCLLEASRMTNFFEKRAYHLLSAHHLSENAF